MASHPFVNRMEWHADHHFRSGNVHLLEVAGIKDALFEATCKARAGPLYRTRLVTEQGAPMTSASGVTFVPDAGIEQATDPSHTAGTTRTVVMFTLAALATLVAGTLLEKAGDGLADAIGMSGILFGATVLAAATSNPAAVASYALETPHKVPGLADLHRMATLPLVEQAQRRICWSSAPGAGWSLKPWLRRG